MSRRFNKRYDEEKVEEAKKQIRKHLSERIYSPAELLEATTDSADISEGEHRKALGVLLAEYEVGFTEELKLRLREEE